MARIRVARGSRTNLPGALDENTLLYGEMYWEREQAGTSDGILYMGKPDGVVDGTNDKPPLAIAGSRAMRSLFFQGLWDPSTGTYPTTAQVGDIYVAEADGTGPASTFKYGDWAVCIGHDEGSSQWLKAINQAITTDDPLGHDRNPLQLNEGVLKLKYDPATLKLNANGELTVNHTEVYTTESSVYIEAGQPVALNSNGKAIIADCSDVDTAIVIGLAVATAEPGDFVTVQRADLVQLATDSGDPTYAPFEIGAPIYLYVNGTYTQDVEQILPGFVLQQVGIATTTDTVDVHIGTPFQIDASSDIYYIPLTQTITPGDSVHAPSSAAVHQIVQQLTNIETEVVTKTDTEIQSIAGGLSISGPVTINNNQLELTGSTGEIIAENLSLRGNLTVAGTTVTLNTVETEIADNIIRINSNQTGVPAGILESGFEVERGDESNYRFIFKESSDTFRIGLSGEEQAVATRVDIISDQTLTVWDNVNRTFTGTGISVTAGIIQPIGLETSGDSISINGVAISKNLTTPVATTPLGVDGYFYATRIYNAVWNDIADFIEVPANTTIEYGKVFTMDSEGNYGVSREYCPAGIMGIASDTYGFGVGQKQGIKQIPIAIGGFVLAHTDKQYAPGTPLTATVDGKLTEMKIEQKRDYPERIVATYWKPEPDAHWNGVLVNSRHWVKVK